jgi:aryl-alcohol dehydrogenase-like predicted oxidoreductase
VRNRYMNDKGFGVLDALDAVAAARNATVLQVALAWQLHLDYVTAPIIGANTVEQLQESLGACDVDLSAEEMARLKEVSAWE